MTPSAAWRAKCQTCAGEWGGDTGFAVTPIRPTPIFTDGYSPPPPSLPTPTPLPTSAPVAGAGHVRARIWGSCPSIAYGEPQELDPPSVTVEGGWYHVVGDATFSGTTSNSEISEACTLALEVWPEYASEVGEDVWRLHVNSFVPTDTGDAYYRILEWGVDAPYSSSDPTPCRYGENPTDCVDTVPIFGRNLFTDTTYSYFAFRYEKGQDMPMSLSAHWDILVSFDAITSTSDVELRGFYPVDGDCGLGGAVELLPPPASGSVWVLNRISYFLSVPSTWNRSNHQIDFDVDANTVPAGFSVEPNASWPNFLSIPAAIGRWEHISFPGVVVPGRLLAVNGGIFCNAYKQILSETGEAFQAAFDVDAHQIPISDISDYYVPVRGDLAGSASLSPIYPLSGEAYVSGMYSYSTRPVSLHVYSSSGDWGNWSNFSFTTVPPPQVLGVFSSFPVTVDFAPLSGWGGYDRLFFFAYAKDTGSPTMTPEPSPSGVYTDCVNYDISLPHFIEPSFGSSNCLETPGVDWDNPILSIHVPRVRVCFQSVTFGPSSLFGVDISLDALFGVLAGIGLLRWFFRS